MTTTNKCNRKQLCGYLKKIFIKDGKEEVNKYNDYLKKELNKKKISLERFQEVQDQLSTVSWWMDNVMPKYNLETLRNEKHERDTKKESKTVTYLCNKIIGGEMSIKDIKSEGYRALVEEYFSNTPFGLPSTSNSALVMADKVQDTVITVEPEEVKDEEEVKVGGTVKEGYLGGSTWTGCNYHGYMRYSEINKIVKKAFQKKYPGVKVSCTGSSFSGGQDCRGVIILPVEKCTKTFEEFRADIDKYYQEKGYCFQVGHYLNSWAIDECNCDYEKMLHKVYDNYVNRAADGYQGISINNLDELDKMILKPEAYEMSLHLNALYDSFNDYDINGMVDYFDTLFYKQTYLRTINGVAA